MNKRNDGCVYTKPWVVRFMFDLCGYNNNQDLTQEQIVEPSCGEGSFVLEAIQRLCSSAEKYNRTVDDMIQSIRAYDIDPHSLSVVKDESRKVLQSNGFDEEQTNKLLNSWFVCGDFIDSSISDADLVIGNPPYIRATDMAEAKREDYAKRLKTFTFGTDIYIAFMEKGLETLNPKGRLCFICSDRWQKNKFGEKFRNFLASNGFHVSFNCQMHDVDAFEENVTAYPAVTVIGKNKGFERNTVCNENFDEDDAEELLNSITQDYKKTETFELTTFDDGTSYSDFPLIEDAGVNIGIGVATGKDKVFITTDSHIVEPDRLLPLAYARDIRDFKFPDEPVKWLVNPWKDGRLVDLDQYPLLEEYYLSHEVELKKRHVAQNHPDVWYRTIDKIRPDLLEKEKLLIRDLSSRPEPILDRGKLYPHHNLYWMTSDIWDLEVLGGILISDVVFDMMNKYSVEMRGGVIRNQAQYLRKIRLPMYESISSRDREMLKKAFDKRDRDLADEICERLYE